MVDNKYADELRHLRECMSEPPPPRIAPALEALHAIMGVHRCPVCGMPPELDLPPVGDARVPTFQVKLLPPKCGCVTGPR